MSGEGGDKALVRQVVALHEAAGRREAGAFLVEGRRAIAGFLAAGSIPRLLLVAEDVALPADWPPARTVARRLVERCSAVRTASGYLAVFPLPTPSPPDPRAGGLVLAGVSDPGNLGTLLRTAAAFALRQVVVCGGADPFGPKAVQASAGALAALQVHRDLRPEALAGGARLCALMPRDGSAPAALAPGPRWLVVGGEAEGVPADWLAACAERLTLPMPGGAVESLNAAVAGAIALWEVFGT